MITFKQYINENINDDKKYMDSIEKNCKQYLKLLKKQSHSPLFRGYKIIIDSLKKLQTRTDRKNSSGIISADETKRINKWLEENGHVRRDKAIITSPDSHWAKQFGNVYYFFPIGKFNYTYVKSKDFNLNSDKWKVYNLYTYFGDNDFGISDEDREDVLKEISKGIVTNKNFDYALWGGYEIWFDCKEYYLVNPDSEVGKNFD